MGLKDEPTIGSANEYFYLLAMADFATTLITCCHIESPKLHVLFKLRNHGLEYCKESGCYYVSNNTTFALLAELYNIGAYIKAYYCYLLGLVSFSFIM